MARECAATVASLDAATSAPRDLVNEKLVLGHFLFSLAFLIFSMMAGWLYSLQLLQMYPLAGIEFWSPGRLRMVHTNGILYGFIANAFFGALHWAIPRLTLRTVAGPTLSWCFFLLWQLAVVATVVGLLMGKAQAIEFGETPVFVDPLVLAGVILIAINFLTPILKSQAPLPVALWYFMSALVWMVLLYAMGNFLPQFFVGGVTSGALIGLFMNDLVGMFVTPIGWGLMYYFVPTILKKQIWSHTLSRIGFWGLAFFYPLSGIRHFLYSPIPTFQQHVAIVATIAVQLALTVVIVNFFATIRHRGDALRTNMPIRWFYLGMLFYLITCLQSAMQVTLKFQETLHFTDWVVGHSHLVMLGVFGFWVMGIMTHLLPRLLGATGWYRPAWNSWHFWLMGISMIVMFLDLLHAGLTQGFRWRDLSSWEATTVASQSFWLVRTLSGLGMFAGMMFFFANIMMTATLGRTVESAGAAPSREAA